MSKTIDYSGQLFGRLKALRKDQSLGLAQVHWIFDCSCGNQVSKRIKDVKSGRTSSCGCLRKEMIAEKNKSHGLSKQCKKEYRSWKDMRSRCNNPNNKDYHLYGGRGIFVCKEWESFKTFFDDMGERKSNETIERIDVNKGYFKENCIWADAETQANNRRNNRYIDIDGEKITLSRLAKQTGIKRETIAYRLNNKMPIEKVISNQDYRK